MAATGEAERMEIGRNETHKEPMLGRKPDIPPPPEIEIYDGTSHKEVLASFEMADPSRSGELLKRLNRAADMYLRLREAYRRHPPAARRQLLASAKAISRGVKPMLDGQRAESRDRLLAEIDWLYETIDLAWIKNSPQQGRKPDIPLHEFVSDLDAIYAEFARYPRRPTTDRLSDEKEGELIRLMQACLRGIGIRKSNKALASLWQRATDFGRNSRIELGTNKK